MSLTKTIAAIFPALSHGVRVNCYEILNFEKTAGVLFFISSQKALRDMSQSPVRIGPRWPRFGRFVERLVRPIYSHRYRRFQVYGSDTSETDALRRQLAA